MRDLFLDIGGTKIRYLVKESDTTIQKGFEYTKRVDLFKFIEGLVLKYSIDDFVGISFAGQVVNNRIVSAPNIKVPKEDIASILKSKYALNVVIENDLKCAALAEYASRKGGYYSLVALFIGSGVGSAVVYNGKLIRGKDNLAGEIGHIHFKEAPFTCGCGNSGCVELFSSGSGIRRWFEHYGINAEPTLDNLKRIDSLGEVKKLFFEGLSLISSVVVHMFDPDIVVLGGGVIEANPELVEYIGAQIKRFSFFEPAKVEKSTLEDAPLEGAMLLKRGDLYG